MKHLFPIFLFLILTASCVQPVDIPPAPQEVFVKCILMNDTVQTVELYYSGAIGADRFEPVENAVVRIEDSSHDSYDFSYAGNGRYISDFQPRSRRSYHLDIRIAGRDPISASVAFPKEINIGSCFLTPLYWLYEVDYNDQLLDQLGEEEWCRLFPWNQVFKPDWIKKVHALASSDDQFIHTYFPGISYRFTGPYPDVLYIVGVNEQNGQMTRAEKLATTHLFVDPTNADRKTYSSGDPVIRTDATIRKYYEYGIASAYDGLTLHDGYLRIASPETYDNGLGSLYNVFVKGGAIPSPEFSLRYAGDLFSVVGDISYDYWIDDDRTERSSLYFCSVSESYDRYLRACHSISAEKSGDLLGSLYSDASRIHSNIEGAYGFFGAMYVLRHDCNLMKIPARDGVDPGASRYDYGSSYNPYPAPLPSL